MDLHLLIGIQLWNLGVCYATELVFQAVAKHFYWEDIAPTIDVRMRLYSAYMLIQFLRLMPL